MVENALVITLTGGLAAGLFFGYITNRLKLSPIVGYLIAGVAVGPFAPGFTADPEIAQQLAKIGVMLLLFGVGLHFNIRDLFAVKSIAILGAIAQIAVSTLLGFLISLSFGWTWSTGIIFGLSLSVASTVVLTRVLIDNQALDSAPGRVAIGWLIMEDLFTVALLLVMPILFAGQASGSEIATSLMWAVIKFGALITILFGIGAPLIGWLFSKVAQSYSSELFTLAVLVTALGVALGSSLIFGISIALGAFLAGMVVGQSEFNQRAASDALPMRDTFAALFFVSVGMLLDPHIFIERPWAILATCSVVIIGKSLAALLIIKIMGQPLRLALSVAVALAQIGEFSFILATLANQLGLFNDSASDILIATGIISISINPLLYRFIPEIDRGISKHSAISRLFKKNISQATEIEAELNHNSNQQHHQAVIVGYGAIGRTVTRLLKKNGISPTVIELDINIIHELKSQDIAAIYGDATRKTTLESSGLKRASTLIICSTAIRAPEELVRQAKELNPDIQVLARTDYIREIGNLKDFGCQRAYSGEGEVALALVEDVLRDLGATAEEISKERERTRNELGSNSF